MADTLRADRAHNAENDRQMRLLAILTPVATLGLIAAGGRDLTGSAASPFASGRITGDPAANLQLADYDHGGTHGI